VKKLFSLAVFILVLFLAACSADGPRRPANEEEMSAYEQVKLMLTNLENYRAIATVEYHSNKGVNTYEVVQHARKTGEYRIEVTGPEHVAGSVTAFDGQQIVQFNSRVNGRVSVLVQEVPERSEIFLTTFARNYLSSTEISVSVADMDEGLRTILEAPVPGNHPYLAISRLWVDNVTLLPVKLTILDQNGAERIVVTYHIFEANVEMDDALFSM